MTGLISILVGFLVIGCQSTSPPELSAFRFDGCSCFPEGTLDEPDLWEEHCLAHDYAYWQGGTWNDRKLADLELRDGIRSEGKPLIAELMYAGVRIGGTPWLPTPWRWGFGWSGFPRGYRTLSGEEKRQVERLDPPVVFAAKKPEQDKNATGQPASAGDSK